MRAFAAALAVAVLALAGCAQAPGIDEISSIAVASGPEPTDPDAAAVQDDPDQIAAFVDLLREHGIDPGSYSASGSCADDRVLRADLQYGATGLGAGMVIPSCDAAAGSFEAQATDLLTGWLRDLSPGTAP